MEKLSNLIAKAKEQGIEIEMVQDLIDENHLDSLWYGGEIAEVRKGKYVITIGAFGDVIATLLDKNGNLIEYVRDKWDYGRFEEDMSAYIKNDKQLYELEESGELLVESNNWFEYNIYDTEKKEYADFDLLENIYEGDILQFFEVSEINEILNCAIEGNFNE